MERFQPAPDLFDRVGKRCRRIVYAGVRDYGQKLVQAGPGDCPLRTAFGKSRDGLIRLRMQRESAR